MASPEEKAKAEQEAKDKAAEAEAKAKAEQEAKDKAAEAEAKAKAEQEAKDKAAEAEAKAKAEQEAKDKDQKAKPVVVTFLKSWKLYNKGEKAGFAPSKAKWLVDNKVAVKA